MIYNNVIKTYGPFIGKKDNRLRIGLKLDTGKTKFMSYPKYLMELHLGRYLTKAETVDHIDKNPLNNDLSNLRVLSRKEHCSNDAIRNKDVVVNCTYCGKEFTIPGSKLHYRNRPDRHQSGYFCSKQCCGKYGAEIQNHRLEPEIVPRVVAEKYTQHSEEKSAPEETQDVESP